LKYSYGSRGKTWMMDAHKEDYIEERGEIYNKGYVECKFPCTMEERR